MKRFVILFGFFLLAGCLSSQPQFEEGGEHSCDIGLSLGAGCYADCSGTVRNKGTQAGTAQIEVVMESTDGLHTVKGYSSSPIYLQPNELKEWNVVVDTSCDKDYTYHVNINRVG